MQKIAEPLKEEFCAIPAATIFFVGVDLVTFIYALMGRGPVFRAFVYDVDHNRVAL